MPPNENLEDALVEEWLSEVADKFFGTRRRLEEKITIFNGYVTALGQKAKEVANHAAMLDYLLLEGKASQRFYRLINAEQVLEWPQHITPSRKLPRYFPSVLGLGRRYTKLVLMVYDGLARECDAYLNGVDPETLAPDDKALPAYYNLVLKMSELINQRIIEVNDGMTSGTMQYVKRFDVNQRQKTRITGALSGDYARAWERKLRFKPIDFESLNLPQYPQLPETKLVSAKVTRFCRQICSAHKSAVRAILSDLKSQIKGTAQDEDGVP